MPGIWSASRSSPGIPVSFGAGTEAMLEMRMVNPGALPNTTEDNYVLTLAGRVAGWTAGTSYIRLRYGGSLTAADGAELLTLGNSGNGVINVSVNVPVETFTGTAPLKITGLQDGGGAQPQLVEFTLTIVEEPGEEEPDPGDGDDVEPPGIRPGAVPRRAVAPVGEDIEALEDIDPMLTLVGGQRNLCLAIARRLLSEPGFLRDVTGDLAPEAASYGWDLRDRFNRDERLQDLAAIEQQLSEQVKQDPRISDARIAVSYTLGSLDIIIELDSDRGSFAFTIKVSELTVSLLDGAGEPL